MRVLLIEDSQVLQEALSKGFSRQGVALDIVGDGAQGLSLARNNPYDVLILDLMLPGLDGMSILRALRESGSDLHILILTARDSVDDRVAGLQTGADDYLVKPFEFEELFARVQALARRKYRRKDPAITIGPLRMDTAARDVTLDGESIDLTHREYELLEYLAYRSGEAVSRIDIEDHLYGTTNLPASNAVDVAVCSLRSKLARYGVQDLIQTRRGVGYILDKE